MPERNSQISRILKLFQLLENARRGLTAREMRHELLERGWELDLRTIYRDIDALQKAGFQLQRIDQGESEGARWKVDTATTLGQHFNLKTSEMIALYLARGYLRSFQDLPFHDEIESIFAKVSDSLGEKAQDFLNELEEGFHIDRRFPAVKHIDQGILETCHNACCEEHLLEVDYHSAASGRRSRRKLAPLSLYFSQGAYYVIAIDQKDHKTKTFAIKRIQEAKMLSEPFEKPDFDINSYLQSSFGIYKGNQSQKVILKITGPLAVYVAERHWHESQNIEEQNDTSVILRFDLDPTPEFKSWILGLGAAAEVLEPESLRQSIKAELATMLQNCA